MSWYFDSSLPAQNLALGEITANPQTTRVAFAAAPHGGPETLWFHFRLVRDNAEPATESQIELVLKHGCNILGGHQPLQMTPVIRADDEAWQRQGESTVEELPDGQWNVVWKLKTAAQRLEVAFCFPYAAEQRETLFSQLEGWSQDAIGASTHSRPLLRWSSDYSTAGSQRPGLYFLARQHAGETPGSWMLDGFLRRISRYRDLVIWGIPLADIDGVEQGDYGKDAYPYDLNRAWGTPAMRHEILAYQWDVNRWSARCRPILALDFHAPGACENEGIYCHLPLPETDLQDYEAAKPWAQVAENALGETYASPNFFHHARYPTRWQSDTSSQFFARQYKIPTLLLEVPYARCGEHLMKIEDYQQAGARLADGIARALHKLDAPEKAK